MAQEPIKIEIWSDLVCPFCYIGKKRLEGAARDEGVGVDVVWRAFELDPRAPAVSGEALVDLIAKKYSMTREQSVAAQEQLAATAAQEGIDFQWRKAQRSNTFDAHRLAHLAARQGLADAFEERFMRAYFSEGAPIGDRATILALAREIGMDEAEARAVLESDRFAEEVRHDERIAREQLDVRGVPYFLIEGRYAISGAQPRATFRQALRRALADE